MKKRNGFVSNSSSSSFMIYGYQIDYNDFKEICTKKNIDYNDYNYLDENTPHYHTDDELNTPQTFLGLSPSSMNDDETMGEFKKKVEKKIEEFLDKKVECEFINHEYYCGDVFNEIIIGKPYGETGLDGVVEEINFNDTDDEEILNNLSNLDFPTTKDKLRVYFQ